MAPLRSLISTVLMFSLLATLFHGPLQRVGRADVRVETDVPESTDEETGLQFRLSDGGGSPAVRLATKLVAARVIESESSD